MKQKFALPLLLTLSASYFVSTSPKQARNKKPADVKVEQVKAKMDFDKIEELQIRTAWDFLFRTLILSFNKIGLQKISLEIYNKATECWECLNEILVRHSFGALPLFQVLKTVKKTNDRFRISRTQYWNTVDKVAPLPMTNEVTRIFMENEAFFQKEVAMLQQAEKSANEIYWKTSSKKEFEEFLKLAKLYKEVLQESLKLKKMFDFLGFKHKLPTTQDYINVEMDIDLINKILLLISQPTNNQKN